jgi:hypothetical membrane protein
MVAGPLYLIIAFVQAITRDGFDVRRHALSHLSNGSLGWIQVLNFLLTGVLVFLGAVGVRRALVAGRARRSGPILLATYGICLLGAGIFKADPAPGFPPDVAEVSTSMSTSGLLHFVFGGVGFYALIGACFVLAWRFRDDGSAGWSAWSAATGVVFFVSFALIASGTTAPAAMLAFYGAVALAWIWHSAIHARLLRELHSHPQ